MLGLMEERKQDFILIPCSSLDDVLQTEVTIDGRQFYFYTDPAVVIWTYIQKAFKGTALSDERRMFNKAIAEHHTAVE